MSDTDQNAADPFQLPPAATWAESVELFMAEGAAWLSAADAPQLMALRSIAQQLDSGKFQAALISQFTLIHRALLGRRPGGDTPPPDAGPVLPTGAPAGGMFELFGGAWRADA
ncbi:hypothetical protein JTF60_gp01 [Microbacterium phage Efeko]|uniref:Uncharacterized protein n=1 Tax=Microbacterium phage Efeko TaxID=2315704 RepID=A0A386KKR2_9CAUD|nr:hypothetical protein JTF60_gp01 [Microbacterium phage Efeko]AYD86248.1 hypothetical protein SEA_EFEKO_1 [Microbacterium phage Efeko]